MNFEFKVTPDGVLLIVNNKEYGTYRDMTEATATADRLRCGKNENE